MGNGLGFLVRGYGCRVKVLGFGGKVVGDRI